MAVSGEGIFVQATTSGRAWSSNSGRFQNRIGKGPMEVGA